MKKETKSVTKISNNVTLTKNHTYFVAFLPNCTYICSIKYNLSVKNALIINIRKNNITTIYNT